MQQNEESKPGPETASVPRPSDAGRGAGEHRRSPGLEWLLARCGCAAPRDVLADLDDEVAAAAAASGDRSGLRDRAWLCWQVSIVCGYELRDSLQRWLGGRRSSWSLKPMLAARLAARSVRRQPAIPLAAAVTLGLGFGAAATIFSVFAGFGRSLPVPQGDRIVEVTLAARGGGGELGLEQFETWRTAGSFEAVTGFSLSTSVLSGDGMYATGVSSAAFTPGLLEMLRVPPLLGRLPARLDDAVVLSHTLWSGYFDADPDLIGRTVRVDGQPREVAAVMPEGFRFPFFESLWIPYGDRVDGADSGPSAAERRASVGGAGRSVQVVGRLAEGVSPERAEAELRGLLLPANRVGDGEPPRVLVRGFTEARGEGGKNVALIALLILVLALLLVSCSNVSNLLLTRALARSRTLSLHAALGADPGQVVLQLFAEALLISLFGAALGAGLAWGASGYIESTLAGNWGYYWMRVGMDARVLRFVLLLAVAVAVIAGALPALRVRRADIAAALKSESSGTLAVGGGWIGRALLGAQVTFSALALLVAMLVAAGLLNTRQVAPGFPSETVQVATVALTGERYESREARRSFRDRLARELIESSSIREVAFANGLPGLNVPFGRLEVDGLPVDPTSQQARRPVVALSTSAEFFDLFGVRLLAGRLPTALDGAGSEPICVVTADFVARRLIGSEELRQHEGPERLADAANSPRPTASADSDNVERHERPTGAALEEALDRRIRLQGVTPEGTWARIVGVVEDLPTYEGEDDVPHDWAFLPLDQLDSSRAGRLFVLVTADGSASSAAGVTVKSQLQAAVAQIDPELPLNGVMRLEGVPRLADVLDYVRRLFETAGLLAALGGLAAVLVAIIGLYGIVRFDVQRRMGELGVRMALGARREQIMVTVLRRGLWSVVPGLVLGLGCGWLVAPLFGVFLRGTEPHAPWLYVTAASGYLLVAAAATLQPARRAARVDPVDALRDQ